MKKIIIAAVVCLCMVLPLALTGCIDGSPSAPSKNNNQQQNAGSDFDNPAFSHEQDGAELDITAHPEEDFVGAWFAPSDYAEYLYGNIELNIEDNHNWKGNLTGDDIHGSWTYDGTGISIKDSAGLIDWNLFFVKDGSLILKDKNKEADISIVLQRSAE